jgi:hypothetical protein
MKISNWAIRARHRDSFAILSPKMVSIIAFGRWQMYDRHCGFFAVRHICNGRDALGRKTIKTRLIGGLWGQFLERSARGTPSGRPGRCLLRKSPSVPPGNRHQGAIGCRLCLLSTRGPPSPSVWLNGHDAGGVLHEEDRFRYSCGACSPEHRWLRSNRQGQGPAAGRYKGVSCTAYVWGKGRPCAGPFLFGASLSALRPVFPIAVGAPATLTSHWAVSS